MHKTGSSSIQWFLHANRGNLKEGGVLYPEKMCPEHARFGHHVLPWLFTRKEGYLPVLHGRKMDITPSFRQQSVLELKREIEGGDFHTVILSSEEFDILSQEEVEEFCEVFGDFEIVPILFIRNYVDFFESAFRTSVMVSRYSRSLEEFVVNQRSRIDYDTYISEWCSIKSVSSMHVLNYDDAAIREDVVRNFVALIPELNGIEISKSKIVKNESYPAVVVELVRFLRSKGVEELLIESFVESAKKNVIPRLSNNCKAKTLLGKEDREVLSDQYKNMLTGISNGQCIMHGFSSLNPGINSKSSGAIGNVAEALLDLFAGIDR